jgi:hypothetical protein
MLGIHKAERRETRTPSPRGAERRHQTSASGGNNYAVLTRTTGASAPPTADSWSGHIYPPLLKQTSWPDGDTVQQHLQQQQQQQQQEQQQQQQQQQLQFPPETVSGHQEAVRNSSAAAATGLQPTGRSPGHAMAEQRGAFSERQQAASKPKAFAAAAGESDKFRALERLNHLASRLRQQLPPSAGVELTGGKDHAASVQAPPRTHHHHQHRVQLKGPGSKSDSDSGFGGDAASTAGTADHKIKQVRGSLL